MRGEGKRHVRAAGKDYAWRARGRSGAAVVGAPSSSEGEGPWYGLEREHEQLWTPYLLFE